MKGYANLLMTVFSLAFVYGSSDVIITLMHLTLMASIVADDYTSLT